jgi:RNA polymerase-binding transcription factor DksA
MPKPTKTDLKKYRALLVQKLLELGGDVGSLKDEALRAADQDSSVDHLADQGTDNWDQTFMLSVIENEEETIQLIHDAIERIDGDGDWPFGACPMCIEEADVDAETMSKKGAKVPASVWIPKPRLDYIPWARYCVQHQAEVEQGRESA